MADDTGHQAGSSHVHKLGGQFASPTTALGALDTGAVAALVAASSDITLVLDGDGTIRDFSIQNEDLRAELGTGPQWSGRLFQETVTIESRPKVGFLLQDGARAETKWRHINHAGSEGRSIPVLYSCVPLGQGGRMVVFGRDMRAMSALQQRLLNAQASLEQDYSHLRDAETRYRLLFQTSSEAVLIFDPAHARIVEANPAAREMLGSELKDIVGHPLLSRFADVDAATAYLAAVRNGETPERLEARMLSGSHSGGSPGGEGREVVVRASAYRQDQATMLLVRISSAHAVAAATSLSEVKVKLLRAVESAPDGFVVADNEGVILTANASFLEMAGLVTEEAARGQPLDRWVGESGVDLTVLIANLRQRGSVRFFVTTLRAETGGQAEVEISAVTIANGGKPSFGFAIRNVGPRLRTTVRDDARPTTKASRALPRSVEQLQELIGRVALKDLVREATEVIERLSIEAALELTNDNRASAAEMLGLSRQSLYVKLRRYGIGDLEPQVPS